MWFIPLILVGVFVIGAISQSPREAPTRRLPPGPPGPGPISVLGEFLRIGQAPPPTVIVCAIAEAEAIGRCDLSSDIVKAFVAPVVYQHQLMHAKRVPLRGAVAKQMGCSVLPPKVYERGGGSCSPSKHAEHERGRGSCAQPSGSSPREAAAVPQGTTRLATDEEIRAMLNADPQAFFAMVASRGAPVIDVPVPAVQATPAPMPPPGLSPETVAQMQEAAGRHEAADRTRAMATSPAPSVTSPVPSAASQPMPGSPLGGVSDGAWCEFVTRLERESPLFTSSRHVGQYHQRRERLADLGIDPTALHGSPHAQRAALDADMVDAHHHAAAGGLLAEHLGRPIAVPGQETSEQLTLSGLLGVIQSAGLEGAVGWLERPSDRKRYPHTTQAFLHTNGIF